MAAVIRTHPENPRIFEFRGQPLVLLTATEHYGAVMNRPFRFERYLADAAEKKITLTRLFTLFRELQGTCNPYSTCKPESPDYIAPFLRVGPGKALDGQPQYDLDQRNPEFFERLHRFLGLASGYGIIVEVVLLSNTYNDAVWALNPLNPRNNINGLAEMQWPEYMSLRHDRLHARQAAHVRTIVEETNAYDNVIYEICNEPGGNVKQPGSPTTDEVNAWQAALAQVIRQTEAALPNRHLIAGQEAFAYSLPDESQRTGPDVHQFADQTVATLSPFDVVNMHPLSNMIYRGRHYDLGQFMAGSLRLRNLRQYCLDLQHEPKPLNLDEDNAASQYKDPAGWTIHRKRAWTTLLCGGHYDYIDFSIINYCETGTPESQRHIRTWMKHLSEYIHSVDLVSARPAPQVVREQPQHTVPSVLAVAGADYSIYLADDREWDTPGAGETLRGELVCALPEGDYEVACYSPTTGLYSPWSPWRGGPQARLDVPPFTHDMVLRLRRRRGTPAQPSAPAAG
jgi:hypothetical protein